MEFDTEHLSLDYQKKWAFNLNSTQLNSTQTEIEMVYISTWSSHPPTHPPPTRNSLNSQFVLASKRDYKDFETFGTILKDVTRYSEISPGNIWPGNTCPY